MNCGNGNRIAVERKRYNDAIQDYNTYIGLFPNSLFAAGGIPTQQRLLRGSRGSPRGAESSISSAER